MAGGFMHSVLKDGESKISSKRLIAFVFVFCLIVILVSDLFFNRTITEFIFDGFTEALIWSLAFIGGEKIVSAMSGKVFSRGNRYRQNNVDEDTDYPPSNRNNRNQSLDTEDTEDDMR